MSGRPSERIKLIWQHIDPSTKDTLVGDSVIQLSKCIDVEGYHDVMCVLFRMTGTGNIQDAALYAASTVTGTGLTQITSLGGSTKCTGLLGTADGTNDATGAAGAGMIVLEANINDISATLANAKYVTARASFTTATDELGVLWVLTPARYGAAGLTATGNG